MRHHPIVEMAGEIYAFVTVTGVFAAVTIGAAAATSWLATVLMR